MENVYFKCKKKRVARFLQWRIGTFMLLRLATICLEKTIKLLLHKITPYMALRITKKVTIQLENSNCQPNLIETIEEHGRPTAQMPLWTCERMASDCTHGCPVCDSDHLISPNTVHGRKRILTLKQRSVKLRFKTCYGSVYTEWPSPDVRVYDRGYIWRYTGGARQWISLSHTLHWM